MRNYFYDDFPGGEKDKKSGGFKTAFLGGLAGALIISLVFLYFLGGSIYPNEDNTPPPGAEGDNNTGRNSLNESVEVPPEAEEYYMAVVEAAERATPSVVGVSNYGMVSDLWGRGDIEERATGSGVIIDSEGLIVTNYHVIQGAEELLVTLGSGKELEAEVVGVDPPTDLAVINIDKTGLNAIEFTDSNELRVGEPALAIGNPLGLDFQQTVTQGVVSATQRSITIQGQKFDFIQTDAAINEGNSGGPLVNIHGEVIGINTAKIQLPGVEGMGFAIPSNNVQEITSQLIQDGRVIRPWMGVEIRDVTPMDVQNLHLPVDYGVLVVDLVPRGPAEDAGIQTNDVIIAIDEQKTENTAELQHMLHDLEIGETISVTVIREQREEEVEITLEEMPEGIN